MSKFWLPKEAIEKAHSMLSNHENIDTFVFNTEPSEKDGKTFTYTSVSAMDDGWNQVGKIEVVKKEFKPNII